ncbi:ThuA domain-containing protein [Thalassoglobus sp. JC818]|uniref:ThuA domain-containing protein n=1 Tax=Thalassoglobus sp. JC818 TaxID=3232136 RepID=UPI003459EC27
MPSRIVCFILFLLLAAIPGSLMAEQNSPPVRILFVTQSKGFVHGSVRRVEELAPAEIALTQLAQQSKEFSIDCTQDCEADFTPENLKNYDIVAFYTSGDLPISEEAMDYFFSEWLREEGHGVLGFHSATDTFHNDKRYWDMIGGTFIHHPWGSGTEVTLTNHEPDNPIMASFGPEHSQQEEIYMYRNWQPEKVRVLMSLDYSKSPTNSPVNTQYGYHVPVCWIKNYGDGKVYVNNLGHREDTWTRQEYLDSILSAIRWIKGDLEVDATPNPELSQAQEAKAKSDFEAGQFRKQK